MQTTTRPDRCAELQQYLRELDRLLARTPRPYRWRMQMHRRRVERDLADVRLDHRNAESMSAGSEA